MLNQEVAFCKLEARFTNTCGVRHALFNSVESCGVKILFIILYI